MKSFTFPLKIYKSKVNNKDFEEIKSKVLKRVDEESNVFFEPFRDSNVKCDYPLTNIDKTKLYEIIIEHFCKYVDQNHVDIKDILIKNLWINSNKKGEYQYYHTHVTYNGSSEDNYHREGNLLYAGTIYIRINNESGKFVFVNPDGSNKMIVENKERDIVIFPSFLSHGVYPSNEDFNRVSVAFNIECSTRNQPWDKELFEPEGL
jgi:uncharacterized protein YjlB